MSYDTTHKMARSNQSNTRIQLNLISAMDLSKGIGRGQELPWRLPSEFHYFLAMTSKARSTKADGADKNQLRNAVVIGRKTWETMDSVTSKPFSGALNIVLSKSNFTEPLSYPDTIVCDSLDSVVNILSSDPVYKNTIDQVWVLGGAEIYRSALLSPHFKRLYLSRIKDIFDCDIFFPDEFNEDLFVRVDDSEINDDRVPKGEQIDETGVRFEVCVYERKKV